MKLILILVLTVLATLSGCAAADPFNPPDGMVCGPYEVSLTKGVERQCRCDWEFELPIDYPCGYPENCTRTTTCSAVPTQWVCDGNMVVTVDVDIMTIATPTCIAHSTTRRYSAL